MENEIILSAEEKEIVSMFMGVKNACTPNQGFGEWTVGMSGENNPFDSGLYCFYYRMNDVFSARRILDHFQKVIGMKRRVEGWEDKTDENIRIDKIYMEYQKNVGTH